jgi:uncharacterized protein (TIGR03437 family)
VQLRVNFSVLLLGLLCPALGTSGSPVIRDTGVVDGASFLPLISSNGWITVFGSELADDTRVWSSSDFNGGRLPTSLGGVRVTINGRTAYPAYISPTQLNVLAPMDDATGQAEVQVITARGTARAFVTKAPVSPGILTLRQGDRSYVSAILHDVYGREGYLCDSGVPSAFRCLGIPPGRRLTIYVAGLGQTTPPILDGEVVPGLLRTAGQVDITIGGQPANDTDPTRAAWLLPSYAGLYQIDAIVPMLPDGDHEIILRVAGYQSAPRVFVPVRR